MEQKEEGTKMHDQQINRVICTVVSFMPIDISEEKPGLVPPRYFIQASDGQIPSVLHVEDGKHFVYLDESRGHLPVRDSPNEVARSIVEDYVSSQPRIAVDASPGIFWVLGKFSPTEILTKFPAECKLAREQQKRWFASLCQMADDDWNKYHQHTAISTFQRMVAELIGLEPSQHEWMSTTTVLSAEMCPACGTPNKPGLAMCPTCRCVLDPEKFKSLKFAS